jgi:hypothetical protein
MVTPAIHQDKQLNNDVISCLILKRNSGILEITAALVLTFGKRATNTFFLYRRNIYSSDFIENQSSLR